MSEVLRETAVSEAHREGNAGGEARPLVSVCIPTYNNAETIAATLASVWNQTYYPIEIVVVDDHSSDGTWEILQGFRDAHIRTDNERTAESGDGGSDAGFPKRTLRIFRNEENLGMAGNWNKSLSLCNGKYLRLLCGDDTLDRDLIRTEVRLFKKHPAILCVSSDTCFIDLNDRKTGYYRRYFKNGVIEGKEAVRFSVFTRDYLGAPLANLFRRDIYEKTGGFDNNFHYVVDYDFFIRIYLSGKIYILHKPLNYFRIRETSNTGSVLGGSGSKDYIEEHKKLMQKHADEIGLSKREVAVSVAIRRLMSELGNLYLKLFLK